MLVLFHREGRVNSTPVSAAPQMLLSHGLVPVHLSGLSRKEGAGGSPVFHKPVTKIAPE